MKDFGKVFLSNRLHTLSDMLCQKLFNSSSNPLEKRWLIVPSEEIKLDLYLRWLSKIDVVTGINTVTYGELIRTLFPAIPSKMELFLRIQTALGTAQELTSYLKGGGDLRKLDLCEELSSLFLRYLQKPKQEILEWLQKEGWQQHLWKEVFKETFPTEVVRSLPGTFFFYHISKIAPHEWEVFSRMETFWFLFSPSEMYLGDFQTEREQLYLLRQAKGSTRDDLAHYFKQDSSLLSNWGKEGRRFLRLFEDVETVELFEPPCGTSALHLLQTEWLTLEKKQGELDLSMQLHSVLSLFQEVEVVWEVIQQLPFAPEEILVLAPDIQPYTSSIEWIFKERGGLYKIIEVEAETNSLLLQAMHALLDLPKYRFSRHAFEKLLLCPPFMKQFHLTFEEAETISEWMSKGCLRYGFSDLKRVVEGLVLNQQFSLDFSDAPLLSRWIAMTSKLEELLGDLHPRTGEAWADWIEQCIQSFFASDEETGILSAMLSALRHKQVEGEFSFLTVEKLFQTTFITRTGSIHRSSPQATRFTSINPGSLTSAKAIILMGMQEGAFPRSDSPSSLSSFSLPNRLDEDRALFLEAVANAKEKLILTYSRCHPEDGKEMRPSSLVEALSKDRGGLTTFVHEKLTGPKKTSPAKHQPLPTLLKQTIDLRMLKKLARHPVKFFFESSVGIRFNWKDSESEFLLSPLEMHHLRTASLTLEELEHQGKLPEGVFREVALQSIEAELESYRKALDKLEIDPASLFSIELHPLCLAPVQISKDRFVYPSLKIRAPSGEVKELQGTIENLSDKGLVVHGENSLEEMLKQWPIYCVTQAVLGEKGSSLCLTKKAAMTHVKIENPLEALSRYLGYLQKSLETPSPLLPIWGRRLFKGEELPEKPEDDILEWAERRALLPSPQEWAREWRPYLQEVFRELL